MFHTDQFHTGTGQICRGRQHITVLGADNGLLCRNAVDGYIVDRVFDFPFVHAHAGGGIGLGVEVAQQHLQSQFGKGRCQVHRGSGFSHAALLVDHSYYSTHFLLLFSFSVFHVKQFSGTVLDCFT